MSQKRNHMNEVMELKGGLGKGDETGGDVKLNKNKVTGQCESEV